MDISRRKSKLIFYSQIDLKPLVQTVLKILNKPNSLMDWGTYASNAIVFGNKNALLNVMDNYEKVKEFFCNQIGCIHHISCTRVLWNGKCKLNTHHQQF